MRFRFRAMVMVRFGVRVDLVSGLGLGSGVRARI